MDMDEFDETAFLDSVEGITVVENSNLEFRFKDGRIKTWERM